MTSKEIKKEIAAHKREMKARGIPKSSFMNGGHSPMSYHMNLRLFQLGLDLENAIKEENKTEAT